MIFMYNNDNQQKNEANNYFGADGRGNDDVPRCMQ